MTATAQESVPVRVGELIAEKYRVEKILGAGAMGVVVAARHVELGQLWAIKFMLPSALGDADGVERFLREARAAARLRSRHVARVHDVGRLPTGAPYLVMEHLEGTDLKALLDKRGPLPVAEAARYLLQACEAMAEAHAAGIVHRDLKPANLFLTTEVNGAPCVKLLDFGIAKMASGAPGAMEMTGTSALLGTPLYMSPEQMRSTRDVDPRSDIWSLGVILYRMLAGKTPFAGSTVTEICSAVISEQPDPLTAIRGDLPPGIEAIVFHCLQKSPAQRFQSVSELAAALGPFANAPAGAQAPVSAPGVASRPAMPDALAQAPTYRGPAAPGMGQATAAGPASQGGVGPPPGSSGHAPAPPMNAPLAAGAYSAPGPALYYGPGHPGEASTSGGQAFAPMAMPVKSSKAPLVLGGLLALVGIAAVAVAAVLVLRQRDSSTPLEGGSATPGASAGAGATAAQPTSTAREKTPSGPAVTAPGPVAKAPGVTPPAAQPPAVVAGGSNLAGGASCSAASQCQSGFCVDRVCCDSACTGKCMACTPAKKFSGGGPGFCGFISGGEDPDHECGASNKRCNGSGSCVTLTPADIKSLTGHN